MSRKNDANKILIPDVPIFHLNWDAGDLYINALQSCLKYLGQECTTWWLAGISGDAFKFVYDRDDVREPMRDRVQIDTVSSASSLMGWEGIWLVDKKIDEVTDNIKKSLQQGFPIITSNLGSQWYHGANIITGIDEDANEFLLQIGREDLSKSYNYEKVPIPEEWDGPVPGTITWGTNPIFLFKKKSEILDEEKVILKALHQAVKIHEIKSLKYKDHSGAQKYSTPSLKGKRVNQGQSALDDLKEEVMFSEITWPKIWSMTTQCGQLSHDRSNAAQFLLDISNRYSQYVGLKDCGDLFKETASNIDALKNSYWDTSWNKTEDFEELAWEIINSHSFVHGTAGIETDTINRLRKVLPIMDTLWGPAIIVDSPNRRSFNKELIEKVIDNEKKCFQLLERHVS